MRQIIIVALTVHALNFFLIHLLHSMTLHLQCGPYKATDIYYDMFC